MSLLYLAEHSSLVTGNKNMGGSVELCSKVLNKQSLQHRGELVPMGISFPLDSPHLCPFFCRTSSSYYWSLWWLCDVSTWVGWISFPKIPSEDVHFRVTGKILGRPGGWKWSRSPSVAHTCYYWYAVTALSFSGSFLIFSDSWARYVCLALWQRALAGYPWTQSQKQECKFQFTAMEFQLTAGAPADFWFSLSDCLPCRLQAPASDAETTALWRSVISSYNGISQVPITNSLVLLLWLNPDWHGHCFDHDDTDVISSHLVGRSSHLWRRTKELPRD